ncbi:UDP-N-acetylmuramoyl-L-alanine--D-glutamate ligase [Candidatus Uhrbacteria bacterium]|nr:UDP-N-acetylmuramoyl-L-alanine--D-glutamate ligase [Candidatus Uhrbacteria bacterium]
MPIQLSSPADIQDKIVTVMGLGRFKQGSGVGAAKWLLKHGAQILVTDLKSKKELASSVDLLMDWYTKLRREFPDRNIYAPVFILGEHRKEDFENVELVVKNPDVPKTSEFLKFAEAAGVRIESDVSMFYRFYPSPIYAVTGTRGKSTTTHLLGEMLRTKDPRTVIGGNVMHSPLEDLDTIVGAPALVALELSSWLLESLAGMDRGSEIAVMTNISKDHLDRYTSYEEYIEAKNVIFKNQSATQKAIANYDDPIVRRLGENAVGATFWFSLSPLPDDLDGAYMDAQGNPVIRISGENHILCHQNEWPALQGEHNAQNGLAASLAASLAGVSDAAICETLRMFKGLEGRQETVREVNGVTYVNDTTATSPEGVIAALKRFGGSGAGSGQRAAGSSGKRIVLITGGKAKGFDFAEMAEWIKKTCKHVVYLHGQHTNQIEALVGGAVPDSHADTMPGAVKAAAAAASEGDIVLLSPGGSSFDLFKNEFDRGGQFVEEVKNLK